MNNDYLIQKKPLNALIIFALPIIIGNFFQQTYTMADSAIVGQFVGEQALAAVGASYSLTNIFIWVAVGGGIGASVIVSHHFGSGDYSRMKLAVYTAFISFLLISIILGGTGLIFSKRIMILMNTPEDVIDLSEKYLNIYFIGLPFLFMYNIISSMFNALGKSKIPLFFLIFSSVFNIFLDFALVVWFNLGVSGVAWATLIAQGISAVLSFIFYIKELKAFKSYSKKLFDAFEFVSMTKVALPSILQQSAVSIGMMLVQSVVNSFGSQVLAGFSAAMRIESLCIVPMNAMSNAISSYTAQNIGAQKYERVVKGFHEVNKMVVFFGLLIFVILEPFNFSIISLFLGENSTITALETGRNYLKFMGCFFSLIGFKMAVDGMLRGAGDMTASTIANFVNLFIRVVWSFLLAPKYGVAMVWIAVPIGWFANWLISYIQYRTGKWKKIYNSPET